MERWVLATLFASSGEPRDVDINMLFVTKMERGHNYTEVEFSSGTQVSVKGTAVTTSSGTSEIVRVERDHARHCPADAS